MLTVLTIFELHNDEAERQLGEVVKGLRCVRCRVISNHPCSVCANQ